MHARRFVGRRPERIEGGVVEHAADALRLRPDHRAGEAGRMRLAQHFGGAGAVLQRHGGERHEARLGLRGARDGLLISRDQAAPSSAGNS